MLSFFVKCYVLFGAFFVVEGTLTPNGTVSLDCGSQQIFTCVTDAAVWTISELSGINGISESTAQIAADNTRITTDTIGAPPSSTITITGFTTADDGGIIQCVSQNNRSVQGMASISVGVPSCHSVMVAYVGADVFALTWQQPPNTPPVASTTVTYCPTSSPNCGNSTDCTSPCVIGGLDPLIEYNFTIIQSNSCGSAAGCTGTNSTAETASSCPPCTHEPTSVLPEALAGAIPSVILIVTNIISAVAVFLITKYGCHTLTLKNSFSKREGACNQLHGPSTYEDITMTDSPAYGPMKQED